MKFTKMQGCGNDYVYINCFEEKVDNPNELAKKVSDRHFGIGSDGLILIKPSETEDFTMHMYNIDGSQAQMCGNGIRCVGKYVYDNGLTDKTSLSIETLDGVKYLELKVEDGKVSEVTVDMGEPFTKPSQVPVVSDKDIVQEEAIKLLDKEFKMTCVSVGNPHAVCLVDNVKEFELDKYGAVMESHEKFPERINAEFVELVDRYNINMRVYERGCAETYACGTGATASAYACILNGYTEDEVNVHMVGGTVKIRYDREKNRLFMTGPAVKTFEGEFFF